jgi:hypothetical protein
VRVVYNNNNNNNKIVYFPRRKKEIKRLYWPLHYPHADNKLKQIKTEVQRAHKISHFSTMLVFIWFRRA